MTTLDIRTEDDERVVALRGAVAELLAGYGEIAVLLAGAAPEVREPLLAPLRRAAESAAAALAPAG